MGFEVNVEYSDSYYSKLNPDSYIKAEEETIKTITMEAEEGCVSEAPVDTGLLRDSHYSEIDGLEGKVLNDVYYAPFVIYGTSRQSPNNYPQRVLNEISGNYTEYFVNALNENGVDTE